MMEVEAVGRRTIQLIEIRRNIRCWELKEEAIEGQMTEVKGVGRSKTQIL